MNSIPEQEYRYHPHFRPHVASCVARGKTTAGTINGFYYDAQQNLPRGETVALLIPTGMAADHPEVTAAKHAALLKFDVRKFEIVWDIPVQLLE